MSREARVGLLVLAGFALFLLAVFAIASRTFLFSNTFAVQAEYNQVGGLQPGAAVQFQGVNVGRVERVALPQRAGGPITVTMAIKDDAARLVHENTQAQIRTDGLVGNQIIVLVNPLEAALGSRVESGETIPGVDPFDLTEVTDRLFASVQTFEEVALSGQEIMMDIQEGEGTLGRIIYDPSLYNSLVASTQEIETTLNRVSSTADSIALVAGTAVAGVNRILVKVDEGDGTLARLLNDPAFYEGLVATSDTLQVIAGDLRAITQSAENAANWGALGAYRFAEVMEAAKHNFLFKRYFEERGYMERAPFEQRERAIEQSYREIQQERRELELLRERLEARERAILNEAVDAQAVRPAVQDTTVELDAAAPLPAPATVPNGQER